MRLSRARIARAKYVTFPCVDCAHWNRAKIVKWDIRMELIEIVPTKCGGLLGQCGYTYYNIELSAVRKLE